MATFPISQSIRQFADRFTQAGFSIYIVGGAVRDHLLGRKTNDFDFATDALPDEVMRLFRSVIPTGIKHGTVTVLFKGSSYEVTTFRIDGTYADNRHPDSVKFVRSLEEDLRRRDFTINALAVDATNGKVIDFHHGMDDLKSQSIRAIGDPRKRFEEDALRILRACRFSAQLEFSIEIETRSAMTSLSHRLASVSAERIRTEIMKMMESPRPSLGIRVMHDTLALDVILPELAMGDNISQKGAHRLDVLQHGIAACDSAPQSKPLVRLAALLHDIGKVPTKRVTESGETIFYQHEIESENMAGNILRRLKFSNEERNIVLNLIRNHMFHYTPDWTDGAVRRFINRVGTDAIADLFDLRLADQKAIHGQTHFENLVEFQNRIDKVLQQSTALTTKDLAINGEDLFRLGIPKGPIMGVILKQLLETVLDDPTENEFEKLGTIALKFYEQRILLPSKNHSPTSSS
jgi:putative nucleotidyltransferase with HDIG domain